MSRYANNTSVSVDRSLIEIEKTLQRAGAARFVRYQDWEKNRVAVAFEVGRLPIRLEIPLPEKRSVEFTQTPSGRDRSERQAEESYTNEVRRRYRVMLVAIKAKIELISLGCSSWEREFLADLMLPTGETVSQAILPKLDRALKDGKMPRLLMAPADGRRDQGGVEGE